MSDCQYRQSRTALISADRQPDEQWKNEGETDAKKGTQQTEAKKDRNRTEIQTTSRGKEEGKEGVDKKETNKKRVGRGEKDMQSRGETVWPISLQESNRARRSGYELYHIGINRT